MKKQMLVKEYLHELEVAYAKQYDMLFIGFQKDSSGYQFKKMTTSDQSELNKYQLQIYFKADNFDQYYKLYREWTQKVAIFYSKNPRLHREVRPFDTNQTTNIQLLWNKFERHFLRFKQDQKVKNLCQAQCDQNQFWLYRTAKEFALSKATNISSTVFKQKVVLLTESLPSAY